MAEYAKLHLGERRRPPLRTQNSPAKNKPAINRLYMRHSAKLRLGPIYPKRYITTLTRPAPKPERVQRTDTDLRDLRLTAEILKCPSSCLRQVTASDLRFRASEGYGYPQLPEAPAIMAFTFKGERRGDHSLKAQELRTVPAPPLKGGWRPQIRGSDGAGA